MRESTATIYTLKEYEFSIIGSKHPTVIFIDHKPIIFVFTQKANPNQKKLYISINFKEITKLTYSLGSRKKLCTTRHPQ